MYIPIGYNCLVAGNLEILNIRNKSFPFDWILINGEYLFSYLNDLINSKFIKFTKNLKYNHRNIVISENYPNCQFLHHDLINNITKRNGIIVKTDNLIETIDRRCNRFMEIIEDKNNDINFICNIEYNTFLMYESIIFEDMKLFINNNNIKCKFHLIVILSFWEEFDMIVDKKFETLKNVSFEKLDIDRTAEGKASMYGDPNTFLNILNKYKK